MPRFFTGREEKVTLTVVVLILPLSDRWGSDDTSLALAPVGVKTAVLMV